jgi:hypothetical protein
MTRINRPDTLFTELRELRRRLRLVEAAATSPAVASLRTASAQPTYAVPLVPARPADWPATESAEWEGLLLISSPAGGRLVLRFAADEGTTGSVRVSVDGVVVAEESPDSDLEVAVDAGEVLVEARRTDGDGAVRVIGWLTG